MRPYLRAANVGWDGLRLDDVKTMNFTAAEMNIYRLAPGDLLLNEASGSRSEVGKPALWQGELAECAFQNTLLRVRPTAADPRFLLHYFRYLASTGDFAARSRGVGIHHLGREALANLPTPLPPRSEQRRIADILDRAGALCAQRRRSISLLDDLGAFIFLDMFGSADHPTQRLEEVVADTKLGLVRGSGELADDRGTPYLRMNAITDSGSLTMLGLKYTQLSAAEASDHRLRQGDLLFNTRNSRELVGKTALVRDDLEGAVFNNNIMRIRFTDRVEPEYMAYAFRTPSSRQFLEASKAGTTSVWAIYYKRLKQMPVQVPPLDKQRLFARRTDAVRRQHTRSHAGSRSLDAVFASLQARAFRGQL